MKKPYILFFFLTIIAMTSVNAQLFLQIEKAGSLKTIKYQIGDQVTFKLKGAEQNYRTEYIENIIPEENIIVFSNGMANLDDITAIRSFHPSRWSKPVGASLMSFGLGWGFFSLVGAVVGTPMTISTAVVVGTGFGLGWLIQKIFVHKTYRIKNKRRLRILDLRVIAPITA